MTPRWRQFIAAALLALLVTACSKTADIQRLSNEAAQAEKQGEHETAIARWTAALRLDPKNRQAYLQRAAVYESTGKTTLAIADYTQYLGLPTNRPSLKYLLLQKLGQAGPWPDDSANREFAFCRRGYLYAKQGDFQKALTDLDQAARLDTYGPIPHLWRAEVLEMKGDPEAALASYTKAVESGSRYATAYSFRGYFHFRRGRLKEALADFDEALRLEPRNATALSQRGVVRAAQGQLDEALNDFDEAAKANPENPEVYIARGSVLMDKGDFRNAFDEFNMALVRRPNDPTALARRGYAWTKRGNIESALADLNQAISLNPAEPSFYVWRGFAWSATNQFDKALADMDHAVQLSSNAPGVYTSRAHVFSKRHEYGKATADFAHGLQLNPANPELLNGLAWLRATCPEAGFRDGKEAVQLATRACELTGFKNPNNLDTLAAAYAESGDFVQAVKYQEQALDLLPTNLPARPRYQEHLAAFQQKKPFREHTQ